MINILKENFRNIMFRFGVTGSIVALYLAAVGMVETFLPRLLIGTTVTLGHIFLFVGALVAGMFSARALKEKSSDISVLALGGFISGAIASVLLVILTFVIQIFVVQIDATNSIFKLREMFVNFSPTLLGLLTFGQGLVLGNLLLILLFGIMGVIGASFVFLPERIRRGWINGLVWLLGIGLFSENVGQILREFSGLGLTKILFSGKALNPVVAVVIFALTFAAGYVGIKTATNNKWQTYSPEQQKKGRQIFTIVGVIFLFTLPWMVGLYLSQALFIIGMYVMMGLGLNIVVGYAGLLDLGYVAFFAFGAYTMGILTSTGELGRSGLNFWTALPFAMLVGVLWGLMLGFPVLRMRGDYLAIVTLGFGEIIRIMALSNWLAPLSGGAQGVLHIPKPEFFGIVMDTPQAMYYLVVLGALLAAFVTVRLRDSRLGRQWMAMREDEDVAEAMGINLVQTKLLAFSIGAAFSALAGAIFAARIGNIFPHSFNILISMNAISLIIVGGLGSIPGVIVGALILIGLPEMLREFAEYRLLMYGILLIVMMLSKPEGFLPEKRRKQALEIKKEQQRPVKQPTGSES